MGFSLVAYTESVDTTDILTEIDAVLDQHITTDGKDVLVPSFAANMVAVFAIGATISAAQISSPTLRKSLLFDVAPLNVGATPVNRPFTHLRFDRPIVLTPGEGLRALVAETAAGAEQESVIIGLEGEPETVPGGEISTVKTTATTTLTAYAWSLCPLTLSQQLEAGRYAIVGMRAVSAGAIAARLVIPGSEYRPGVIAAVDEASVAMQENRYGRLTVFGEFEHTFVPQAEFFSSSADTTETVYLDVIKL